MAKATGFLTIEESNENYNIMLTNEAISIACDKDGNPLSMDGTTTTVLATQGIDPIAFTIGTLTSFNCSGWVTGGNTITIENNSVFRDSDSGYIDIPVNIKGILVATKRFSYSKVKAGAQGAPGKDSITGVLSNESHVIPTDLNGNNGNFTSATTTMSIYNGSIDDSANWTLLASPGTGVSGSLLGKTYTVTALTTDIGYIDLTASRSGYSNIVKRFTISKGKQGIAGNNAVAYWLINSVPVIKKDITNVYTPGTITVSGKTQVGLASPTDYSCRFIISDTTNGTTYIDRYTSAANEISKVYTPLAGIVGLRVRMYLAGGATTLLDEQTIAIVSDGSKGETGGQGSPGIPGSPGINGVNGATLYTWLKYADTPTTGMNDSPTGKTYMGIAYNKTVITESSVYADYEWSLIKGTDGINGGKGIDGVTTYTWVKYATNASGAGINDSPTGMTYIGFAFNKTTATKSTVTTDYTWSLIQGVTGTDGLTLDFTNDNTTIPCDKDGNNGVYTNSGTVISLFEGVTALTYDGVGTTNGTWKIVMTPTSITVGSVTDSGTYATIGNVSAMTADTAKVSYLITGKRANGTAISLTRVHTFSKSKVGATGATGSSANVPAYITATKITQTTIESPTITAGIIQGAVITGGVLKTNTTDYIDIQRSVVKGYNGTVQSLELGVGIDGSYNLPYISFIPGVAQGGVGAKKTIGLTAAGQLTAYINSIENDLYIYGALDVSGNVKVNGTITGTNFTGIKGSMISADRGTLATDLGTAREIRWRNYGNNHTIIDNSKSEYGTGGNKNPMEAWSPTYPTLMGWNGTTTYGVRVDCARYADTLASGTTVGTISTITASNWFRSTGATGWYNETYAGGIHMTDATWLRAYGNTGYLANIMATDRIYGTAVNGWYMGNGNCRLDVTDNVIRLYTSARGSADTGLMYAATGLEFKIANVTKFYTAPNGTKTGGFIELDGMNVGLSPVDSPRVLHQDIIYDAEVEESGTTVFMDELFAKSMDGYAVFPSNGKVEVIEKNKSSFKVKGFTGKVDFNIVGNRRDMTHQYFDIQ